MALQESESKMRVAERFVGLDIGSSAIKAVELARTSGSGWVYDLVKLGVERLPLGAIAGDLIKDRDAVAGAIARLFEREEIETRDVAVNLSGNGVVWATNTMPHLTQEEFAESVAWEAEQYIAYDIQDVVCDYEILNDDGPGGEMAVRFVAIKKDKMSDYAAVVRQAGCILALRDLDLFAVQSCFESNYHYDPARVVALLNVGASIVNLNVVKGRRSIFSREIWFGGNHYTEAIREDLGLSFEEAEALKIGGRSPHPPGQRLRDILRSVSETLASEVTKSREFMHAVTAIGHIDQILLSGGAANTIGLRELLGERLQTGVEILNPFHRIPWDPQAIDSALVENIGPAAAIAVGLAARQGTPTKIEVAK